MAVSGIAPFLLKLTHENWIYDYRALIGGSTIIRTDCADDAKFYNALWKIRRFVEFWIDNEARMTTISIERLITSNLWPLDWPSQASKRLNDEFLGRFIKDGVDNRDRLDGASIPQICQLLKEWAKARWHTEPKYSSSGGPRLKSAVLLDTEAIEHLNGLP
ncbi:hypothetical protein B9Z65_7269 [Elsinoe australis]|uniref:Uncharacterized protein n=1 Tax=Elsinoe australis TaxID=40998 RepID=A0A2P7Z6D1_9PEZI|nr:hypothetical protein B9Z65_7269 [Elsinoe australis]